MIMYEVLTRMCPFEMETGGWTISGRYLESLKALKVRKQGFTAIIYLYFGIMMFEMLTRMFNAELEAGC